MNLTIFKGRSIKRVAEGAIKRLIKEGIRDLEIVFTAHYMAESQTAPFMHGIELRAEGLAIVELFHKHGNLVRQSTPGAMSISPRLECLKILDSYFKKKGIFEEEIIERWNGLYCIRDGSRCQPGLKPKGFCNIARCGG